MRENRLKCFEHIERRNNEDIVKKICEIRVEWIGQKRSRWDY